jgi:hypothetical protein
MKSNPDIERVYELLEQHDFNELSEKDKNQVLSMMTEKEYVNMRDTLKDTGNFFNDSEELILNDSLYKPLMNKSTNGNLLIMLLKKPVQIYKAAALALMIIGIYSIIHYSTLHNKNGVLALNDTIYVHKTDTVYSKLTDTVRIIKEKIIYISQEKDHIKPAVLSTSTNIYDCSKEICPDDIDKIIELAINNNISRDTLIWD